MAYPEFLEDTVLTEGRGAVQYDCGGCGTVHHIDTKYSVRRVIEKIHGGHEPVIENIILDTDLSRYFQCAHCQGLSKSVLRGSLFGTEVNVLEAVGGEQPIIQYAYPKDRALPDAKKALSMAHFNYLGKPELL